MNRTLLLQVRLLGALILANFVAQVPYFLYLYATPQHPFPNLKSALLMGAVLALFLTGYLRLERRKRRGYPLLLIFLCADFGFYLWNLLGSALHGYGWFFHLSDQDMLLRSVFAIGYINFFAAGGLLMLLLARRDALMDQGALSGDRDTPIHEQRYTHDV